MGDSNTLLVAVTEMNDPSALDEYVAAARDVLGSMGKVSD